MTLRTVLPILLAVSALASDEPVTWKRWELLLKAPQSGEPAVTFRGPGGVSIQAPTFRAADGTLRARVAFPKPGRWTWEAPDGARGRVKVSAYKGSNPLYRHGFLRVSANGRYLEHTDKTPFLWMGDTAWFGITMANDAEWSEYLDHRVRGRFTLIQAATLGLWPRLLPGAQAAPPFDAAGAPNPAHWERLDAHVRAANERGLMVFLVGFARPPSKTEREYVAAKEFAHHVAARFFGDHVIYSPSFDQLYDPLFDRIAENLRAYTPLHLITQHPGTRNGQNDIYVPKPYLSFSGMQSGHHEGKKEAAYTAAREWPLRLRSLQPVKPVINIEAMYDGRGSDEGPAWRVQDARKLGWISWLSGALGYTYGAGETARKVPGSNGGIWGFNQNPDAWDHWRKAVQWPSAGHMTNLRDFMGGIQWWRLEPAPRQVQNTETSAETRPLLAIAEDRGFAVGYLPVPLKLSLDMSAFAGPMKAEWYNPLTGERVPVAEPVPNSGTHEFTPPPQDHDWVLWLKRS